MPHLLAVFDVDGTLIQGYSQRHLLHFLRDKGYIGLLRYTLISIWFLAYSLRITDSPARILRFALSGFIGMTETDIDRIFDDFFESVLLERIYPDSLNLIKDYQSRGYEVVLLSAAIDPIIRRCAVRLGADRYESTRLVFKDRILVGVGDSVYGRSKAAWLKAEQKRFDGRLQTASFADHYSDIPLLDISQEPHAVNPDHKLAQYAQAHSWPIISFRI